MRLGFSIAWSYFISFEEQADVVVTFHHSG